MATIFRLGSSQILGRSLRFTSPNVIYGFIRPVSIKVQPYKEPPCEGHDERNMKLGRPQSPHLSIYKPQLTSMTSITHRATGLIVVAYTMALGWGAVVLPDSIPNYIDALADYNLSNSCLYAGKYAIALPFCYHFWNGIRHLSWDMGKGMKLKEMYLTGYIVIALTFISTGIVAAL